MDCFRNIRLVSERSKRKSRKLQQAVIVEIVILVNFRLLPGASYLDVFQTYQIRHFTDYSVFNVFNETLIVYTLVFYKLFFPITSEQCTTDAELFCTTRKTPFYGVILALDDINVFGIHHYRKYQTHENIRIEKGSLLINFRREPIS